MRISDKTFDQFVCLLPRDRIKKKVYIARRCDGRRKDIYNMGVLDIYYSV